MIATVVDVEALLKVIVASLVAGIGITAVFSIAVHGATRSSDMRHSDRPVAASAYGVLAVVGTLACLAAVAFGIVLLTRKG